MAPEDPARLQPLEVVVVQHGVHVQGCCRRSDAWSVDPHSSRRKVSVFDGIVVQTEAGARFVDADHVASIYTTYVRTTLSTEQAANLAPPEGSTLIDIKPPGSMAARLGRRFGRRKR